MRRLDLEQDVIALARELGLQGSPVEALLRYCQKKIDGWVAKSGTVRSIADLESLVCKKLRLVFEEFRSDKELSEAIKKYTSQGEAVFASVPMNFDDGTYGTLVERRRAGGNARDRYVALIDCRGEKAARRFFTRWHEIAHLLTLTRQVELPLYRASDDPLERLMDEIAGQLGFYEPLFRPILQRHHQDGRLSFESVEATRNDYCPEASFQATLFACQRHTRSPVIYVEAAMGYKVDEVRRIKLGQKSPLGDSEPKPKLRVKMIVPNAAAIRERFQIAPNMRVPESSIIHRTFSNLDMEGGTAAENMRSWESTKGGCLPPCEVYVEARRMGNRVIALVQSLETIERKQAG